MELKLQRIVDSWTDAKSGFPYAFCGYCLTHSASIAEVSCLDVVSVSWLRIQGSEASSCKADDRRRTKRYVGRVLCHLVRDEYH